MDALGLLEEINQSRFELRDITNGAIELYRADVDGVEGFSHLLGHINVFSLLPIQ